MKMNVQNSTTNQPKNQYPFQELDSTALETLKGGTRNTEAQIRIKIKHGI